MKLINYHGNSNNTGVYLIKNLINNKVYVGSTKTSFKIRKNKHLRLLRKNIHYNEHLQNAWNYYGEDNFIFEILMILNPNECDKFEGETIKLHQSNNRNRGYNIASVSTYKFNYKISSVHNNEKSSRKKRKANIINGHSSNEKGLPKPFKIYDLNGNFIKEYLSALEYVNENGGSKSHISIVLSKRKLFYRNQIIIFSNDVLTDDDIFQANKKTIKKVYLFNLNGEFINEFPNASECANFIGCKVAEIRMCCLNKRSRIKNYITKYEK